MAISYEGVLNFMLFPAQMQDFKTVEDLWQDWPWQSIDFVVADKGYDSNKIRNHIKEHGAMHVIPSKGRWVKIGQDDNEELYDKNLYKKRNIIERFFGRLKENKRIAMRFDKLDFTFLSFIALAACKLLNLFC